MYMRHKRKLLTGRRLSMHELLREVVYIKLISLLAYSNLSSLLLHNCKLQLKT